MADSVIHTGNYFDKYRSGNPIHRFLMKRFLADVKEAIESVSPASILEVGCGAGDLAHEIAQGRSGVHYTGVDIGEEEIVTAKRNNPSLQFLVANAYELPFPDQSFDLVMGCEVLEHLEDPGRALSEMRRVSKRGILVSVPWEPLWRIFNMLRGAYITQFGNSPGHIQHFSRKSIRMLVSRFGKIVLERHPLPWTVLLTES